MPDAIKNIKIHPVPPPLRVGGRIWRRTPPPRTQKDYKWEGILDNICTLDVDCNVHWRSGGDRGCTAGGERRGESSLGESPSASLMSVCINLYVLYLNIFVMAFVNANPSRLRRTSGSMSVCLILCGLFISFFLCFTCRFDRRPELLRWLETVLFYQTVLVRLTRFTSIVCVCFLPCNYKGWGVSFNFFHYGYGSEDRVYHTSPQKAKNYYPPRIIVTVFTFFRGFPNTKHEFEWDGGKRITWEPATPPRVFNSLSRKQKFH